MNWLLELRIDHRPFLVGVDTVMILSAVVLIPRPRRPGRWANWLVPVVVGAVLGLSLAWLLGDVGDVFGISLTLVTRTWVCIGSAGIALAVVRLRGTAWWRKAVAVLAIPVMAIGALAGINVDFGAYRNLHDALGLNAYPPLASRLAPADTDLSRWHPPADMPRTGVVRRTGIPATSSRFAARDALVYLPPAALTADPPRLPVIVMFSGQPGAPADMFAAARSARVLDAYAARHEGVAPIVVVPDQLGAPDRNPMCVDSPLGDSARYVTVDVTRWIRAHLPVVAPGRGWAVAGYSEGGTCAMQFGAARPDLFASILSISGELAPTIGDRTVQVAFHGSQDAYERAKPLSILAANRPYRDSFALFAAGSRDERFTGYQRITQRAASRAGMRTRFISSPGTAHDWNTVRYVIARALPMIADRLIRSDRP